MRMLMLMRMLYGYCKCKQARSTNLGGNRKSDTSILKLDTSILKLDTIKIIAFQYKQSRWIPKLDTSICPSKQALNSARKCASNFRTSCDRFPNRFSNQSEKSHKVRAPKPPQNWIQNCSVDSSVNWGLASYLFCGPTMSQSSSNGRGARARIRSMRSLKAACP